MVAQARGGARTVAALQDRQAAPRDRAGPLERAVVTRFRQRHLDERDANAPRAELGAEPRRPVAAGRARGHPVAREGLVVEIAASGEIGDDRVGDLRGRPAPAQARGQVARGPRAAGEQVGGGEPRGPRVECSARTARTVQDRLKKELPAGEIGAGARSVARCSNDCSPVEKIPRTFRSKSSALVAASRAVSYEMTPSR